MSKQYKVQVTESKSVGTLNPLNHCVRVFVDNDMRYGYWVPENTVVDQLTSAQLEDYLKSGTFTCLMSKESAQRLIDEGSTIYSKVTLR